MTLTRRLLLATLIPVLAGAVLAQTHPTTAPATQPAKPGPQVVFILGYGTTDGLIRAIDNFWRPRLGANAHLLVTVYTHDVAAEIAATFPAGELRIVGFSHGGWKAVEVAKGMVGKRNVQRLVLLDPVPFPNPKPNYPGFDLPDNILSATCYWRGYADQHTLFSGPIKSAKCEYENIKYNSSNPDEATRHGIKVWDPATVNQALK